jgi:3-hydroxyacyl-CoA dehydrogenase
MGSAIAAHFANAGVPSLVLDIVPRELTEDEERAGLSLKDRKVRDRIARESVAALSKARPAPLFSPSRAGLIQVGNLEDDLHRLAEVDWVIEVVREDMAIKKKVLPQAAAHLQDDAVLSSNTSGLSLTEMASSLPESVRPRFLGTHFFNPPRYMRLLELIPTSDTSPEVLEQISEFACVRLGKGIVPAKDTPNFIANRIGLHAIMVTLRVMQEMDLTVEEVDALTGPAMARPKTGTFRLADLVGLDTLLYVAKNTQPLIPNDEGRDVFDAPEFLEKMVQAGQLGLKSGAGFYRKVSHPKKTILTFDSREGKYREPLKPEFPELEGVRRQETAGARVQALIEGEGRGSQAAWKILAPTLSYAAMRLGEIADTAATLDDALKLGFNWELGPFEIWDALGFRQTTERLRADGYALPAWVDAITDGGGESLYREVQGRLMSPAATTSGTAPVASDPREIRFDSLRASRGEVKRNGSASLIDLGDGLLGLEFHSKMNALDAESIEMMMAAADEAEAHWQGLVVANDGVNFCAGANLMLLVQHARSGDWKAIEKMVRAFQGATDRLEQSAVPVVVAPHGMALGGGAEVVLSGNAVRAAAESYIGLVEVGAGLIPAGGGCLRLYKRQLGQLPDEKEIYPALVNTFQAIGMARVSTSAEVAQTLGFLRAQDGWSMNRTHLVSDARQIALALSHTGFAAPSPRRDLPVMGRGGLALLASGLVNMAEGRFISEHDVRIGRELATILSGGDVAGPTTVSEQHLLDLECESFLRLCGEAKTHERMISLLETGKPLRN